jgi:hypothetical protein
VQYTLRLSYDESDQVAGLARGLRRDLGRVVDQSEVLRALADLATTEPIVRLALVHRLQDRPPHPLKAGG